MNVTIYHNPRCSKSRQTLALLEEHKVTTTIVEYLKNPPNINTLQDITRKLNVGAQDIMRTGEDAYKAARDEIATMTEVQKIAWLAANPKVIQRPIVVAGERARIGRPPENILEIID